MSAPKRRPAKMICNFVRLRSVLLDINIRSQLPPRSRCQKQCIQHTNSREASNRSNKWKINHVPTSQVFQHRTKLKTLAETASPEQEVQSQNYQWATTRTKQLPYQGLDKHTYQSRRYSRTTCVRLNSTNFPRRSHCLTTEPTSPVRSLENSQPSRIPGPRSLPPRPTDSNRIQTKPPAHAPEQICGSRSGWRMIKPTQHPAISELPIAGRPSRIRIARATVDGRNPPDRGCGQPARGGSAARVLIAPTQGREGRNWRRRLPRAGLERALSLARWKAAAACVRARSLAARAWERVGKTARPVRYLRRVALGRSARSPDRISLGFRFAFLFLSFLSFFLFFLFLFPVSMSRTGTLLVVWCAAGLVRVTLAHTSVGALGPREGVGQWVRSAVRFVGARRLGPRRGREEEGKNSMVRVVHLRWTVGVARVHSQPHRWCETACAPLLSRGSARGCTRADADGPFGTALIFLSATQKF
jgi:hypothetical protein